MSLHQSSQEVRLHALRTKEDRIGQSISIEKNMKDGLSKRTMTATRFSSARVTFLNSRPVQELKVMKMPDEPKMLVIRLRSVIDQKPETRDTLNILKLRKVNSFVVVPASSKGMMKKVEGLVTWGEADEETLSAIGGKGLHPPKGGFASLKRMYPKGELGYRGKEINSLARRMME